MGSLIYSWYTDMLKLERRAQRRGRHESNPAKTFRRGSRNRARANRHIYTNKDMRM